MLLHGFIRRSALLGVIAGAMVAIASTPASAFSTDEIVRHADGKAAGEVWFNSGYSAIHDGHPQYGENSFTVRDRSCEDGWGIGVEWELNGQHYSKQSEADCKPNVEFTFQANPNQPYATGFKWRAYKWDTHHQSPTTFEPWRNDWMGSKNSCKSQWIERVAAYGYNAPGLGYTFEITIWPTKRAESLSEVAHLAVHPQDVQNVWRDVQDCTLLPGAVTQKQRESMFLQLGCHVALAKKIPILNKQLGGATWDLEATRGLASPVEQIRQGCNWTRSKGPVRSSD